MRRELLPVVILMLLLLIARQALPYVESDPKVGTGFEVELIKSGLGGPTCLHWVDESHLLVCDRDSGSILILDENFTITTLLPELDRPHGVLATDNSLFISEAGKLTKYDFSNYIANNSTVLVTGIADGNHQTNAINMLANGTLIWHSGSTCNVCTELDERNGALLWVDPISGEHGVLASGVRNSFDGTLIEDMGYVFTDNGRDWEGEHPFEEINLLEENGAYGWPDDDPDHPIPEGTIAPIATWTAHTSVNGIDVRPENSSLPGGEYTAYASVYGSWNTILPQGHEIIRIDFSVDSDGNWEGETTRFATDLGTPLPLRFHPNGDLYYATFGNDGSLYRITGV